MSRRFSNVTASLLKISGGGGAGTDASTSADTSSIMQDRSQQASGMIQKPLQSNDIDSPNSSENQLQAAPVSQTSKEFENLCQALTKNGAGSLDNQRVEMPEDWGAAAGGARVIAAMQRAPQRYSNQDYVPHAVMMHDELDRLVAALDATRSPNSVYNQQRESEPTPERRAEIVVGDIISRTSRARMSNQDADIPIPRNQNNNNNNNNNTNANAKNNTTTNTTNTTNNNNNNSNSNSNTNGKKKNAKTKTKWP